MISFVKYHGTGNDFILIDDRDSAIHPTTEEIRSMCDRHFGIGADGLILIRQVKGYDFEMVYYNSDGNRSSMCGNGGRCSVAFATDLGLAKDDTRFLAFDGEHKAKIVSRYPFIVSLHMSDVSSVEKTNRYMYLNTGSPHYVEVRDNVEKIDVLAEGRRVRYNERFSKEGTNVNFMQLRDDSLYVRTYERGVEGETLSCGTGVTACVIAAADSGLISLSPGKVITPGGNLSVYFHRDGNKFDDIWLEGEVVKVFTGQYQQ